MVASCNSAMEGWKNHFHSFYICPALIAALKWNKGPRDLTKIPQVHVGGDDEGEGEVELLVRHSAVLRPLEVTGEAALVDGVLSGSLTLTGEVVRVSSYILS